MRWQLSVPQSLSRMQLLNVRSNFVFVLIIGEIETQLVDVGTSWIYTTLELLPTVAKVASRISKLKVHVTNFNCVLYRDKVNKQPCLFV